MLNVPLPSPPVPTTSTVPSGASTRTTRSRIAVAKPGQLVDGLAAHPETHEQRRELRRRRLAVHDLAHRQARVVEAQRAALDDGGQGGRGRGRSSDGLPARLGQAAVANEPVAASRRARLPFPGLAQEVRQQVRALRREDALGVELHALERQGRRGGCP